MTSYDNNINIFSYFYPILKKFTRAQCTSMLLGCEKLEMPFVNVLRLKWGSIIELLKHYSNV